MHFQVRVGVFNCQQILTKICLVVFCAEMLEQRQKATNIMCFFHIVKLYTAKINTQGVLITQPTKSKSLFELIKESVISVTLLIIFAVLTYFQLSL